MYIVCVNEYTLMAVMRMWGSEQFVNVGSLLPHGSQEMNSGCWAW